MILLTAALLFFVVAALGGAVLARAHLGGTNPSQAVVVGHPLLAASGLILVGAGYVRAGGTWLLAAALIVLAVAAAGGMGLALLRVRRGRAPAALIAVHALVALTGVTLLVLELLAGRPGVPAPLPGEIEGDSTKSVSDVRAPAPTKPRHCRRSVDHALGSTALAGHVDEEANDDPGTRIVGVLLSARLRRA